MKNIHPYQILFLGVAFLLAIFALTQALHEEAYAIPYCHDQCVCNPSPCGVLGVLNSTCFDTFNCRGIEGTYNNCRSYCSDSR